MSEDRRHHLRSIGHVRRLQRILDNDADYVTPKDMLSELHGRQRTADDEPAPDARCATTTATWPARSLLEVWIDEAERRTWFLFEVTRADRP